MPSPKLSDGAEQASTHSDPTGCARTPTALESYRSVVLRPVTFSLCLELWSVLPIVVRLGTPGNVCRARGTLRAKHLVQEGYSQHPRMGRDAGIHEASTSIERFHCLGGAVHFGLPAPSFRAKPVSVIWFLDIAKTPVTRGKF